jgi:threonine/homoserine/homoserine lactone efflux protein
VSTQILALGSVLIAIGLVMDGLIGLMSGTFSSLLLRRPAFERWLKRISGVIFGGLALRLLTDH